MSPVRAARRLITIPVVLGWHLLVLLTSPVLLVFAALAGIATRSSLPARTVMVLVAYAELELAAMVRIARLRALGGDGDWQELVGWFVESTYAVTRRVLDVAVQLENGSARQEDVSGSPAGVVVLARHCGPGDSLLIAWLLVVHYGLRLRVVLKSLLRLVPVIDLAGDALPFVFVGARGLDARSGIAALARGLERGDGLLLFPEGQNFSPRRWGDALRKLAASGERLRLRRLRDNTKTLPPHVGGVTAALAAAPQASVLLLAHTGLAGDGADRPWWRLPLHQDLTIRTMLIPAADVPRDPGRTSPWLDQKWTEIDAWVHGHAAERPISDPSRDLTG